MIGNIMVRIALVSIVWILPVCAHFDDNIAHRERVLIAGRTSDTDRRYTRRVAEIEYKRHPEATVIICHGFMCCKQDITFLRWLFPRCNTVLFDFRGHGEQAEGQCCTFGYDEAHDVIAAAEYAHADPALRRVPIVVYGFSMGAAASIRAQAMRPGLFDGAIWDSPFDTTRAMLERTASKLYVQCCGYTIPVPGRDKIPDYIHYPWVQRLFKAMLKTVAQINTSSVSTCIMHMEPEQLVKQVTIPALFIGCWNDERTPYEAVASVYNNASGEKRLWMSPGRKHFDSFFHDPDAYADQITRFMREHIV